MYVRPAHLNLPTLDLLTKPTAKQAIIALCRALISNDPFKGTHVVCMLFTPNRCSSRQTDALVKGLRLLPFGGILAKQYVSLYPLFHSFLLFLLSYLKIAVNARVLVLLHEQE
jgi:hypothetical protein